jgi:hypothetical protein
MHPAKNFFIKTWNHPGQKKASEKIIQACMNITHQTSLEIDILIIASWLYALGKLRSFDNYHIESLYFLDVFVKEHPEYKEHYDTLIDCILHHVPSQTPTTVHGRVFKVGLEVSKYKL